MRSRARVFGEEVANKSYGGALSGGFMKDLPDFTEMKSMHENKDEKGKGKRRRR